MPISVSSMDFRDKTRAFTLLEVLVAALFTALVLGTALSALSAAGLYFFRAHEKLSSLDEHWSSLFPRIRSFMEHPGGAEEYAELFRFKEAKLRVISEEEEEEIPVLRVELKEYPLWFFVLLPEGISFPFSGPPLPYLTGGGACPSGRG